ncbi:MAG: cyclodeaminase/cyclohydrolase family protein [Methylococcaceae bacterium]|nr:cyclodeaminase/cyclohydrolase family protein [Methylococcaceae bacterium]
MIKEASIEHFLHELASKSPTPGGGSAAAIMGAMGAALVAMVCNLTVGKKNYEDVSEEMAVLLPTLDGLRTRLVDMVAADVAAFDQVMAAYGMPRETDADKQRRSAAIQSALKQATLVPLECARACVEVIGLSRVAAEKGNKNVISDAGVAVVVAHAALRSAALNVRVNTSVIRDEAFVTGALQDLANLMSGVDTSTEQTYQLVMQKL